MFKLVQSVCQVPILFQDEGEEEGLDATEVPHRPLSRSSCFFLVGMDSFFFYVILLLVHLGFVEANAPQEEETVMMMALTMLRFHN